MKSLAADALHVLAFEQRFSKSVLENDPGNESDAVRS